ncbi:hypothetical protein [Phenylobacterium sp.]|uniref:hypothetical protein n=1 Tax=Phenylobacterium sp. TaxID=1871053 RepID=UPI003563C410
MISALAAFVLVAATPDSCRTVHGRMDLWNGAPTVRIRVIGTRRVLGVVQPHERFDDLPPSVRRIWTGQDADADWKTSITGDFKVCAVRPERPGRMPRVRLIAAGRLTARARP